jgi:hypothetical protein
MRTVFTWSKSVILVILFDIMILWSPRGTPSMYFSAGGGGNSELLISFHPLTHSAHPSINCATLGTYGVSSLNGVCSKCQRSNHFYVSESNFVVAILHRCFYMKVTTLRIVHFYPWETWHYEVLMPKNTWNPVLKILFEDISLHRCLLHRQIK